MPVIFEAFPAWRRDSIRQHTWKWVAACVAAAGAVGWFLYAQLAARGFDWRLAARSFAGLRWGWLLLSLVPIAGTYGVRALRWAVFLKPLKAHPSLRNLLSATLIGFTAITLFGRPGEFVRPYLIARKEEVPATSQFAAWLLERVFDLLMALLVFAFALTRVQASGVLEGSKFAWVLAVGGRIVGLAALGGAGAAALFPALGRAAAAAVGRFPALPAGGAVPQDGEVDQGFRARRGIDAQRWRPAGGVRCIR